MTAKLLQKETTYDIVYKDTSFLVTIMVDMISGLITYDFFGPNGEDVHPDLELEIIEKLENIIE